MTTSAELMSSSRLKGSTCQTELSWAAGFFDGEGCTCLSQQELGKYRNYRRKRITLSIRQANDPYTLHRFRKAVMGLGKVRGPYSPREKNHSDYYQYDCTSIEAVQTVGALLWNYLSEPKKMQFKGCWKEFTSQPLPQIGHPKQKYCKRGHDLDNPENVYQYSYGRRCKICTNSNLRKRRQRARKETSK